MNQIRRALVTGGSSGIGRAAVEALARDGCDVGVLHVGDPGDGSEVAARVEALGRRSWTRICDVADPAQVNEAVESFVAHFGGLDVLVNSAGIFRDQVAWKMSDADWRSVIDVDLSGAFHCCRAAVAPMRAAGWGAVVNITSINGLRGKVGQTNYCAAKAGLIGMTKALARELARFNITVNAVAPGLIDTPATAKLPSEVRERALGEIVLGRIGRAEDVSELVAFLCSDRARFITGEVIRVDGGQCM
jgi:3-oxoacyl-[acyl-carrier protein] reductase